MCEINTVLCLETPKPKQIAFGPSVAYSPFRLATGNESRMAISFQGFPSLVENNPDAISLLDNQGEILHRGASGAEIFWANRIMRGCDLGLALQEDY